MAQAGKGRLNFRCPSCFMRDIDMDMFFDKEKGEYYCLHGARGAGKERDGALPLQGYVPPLHFRGQ